MAKQAIIEIKGRFINFSLPPAIMDAISITSFNPFISFTPDITCFDVAERQV
ncbi:MAG: hypothetical protein GY857_01070 [Desulfobacula sp.]|nr:hypothetical protein [Desulfobacula sp.]